MRSHPDRPSSQPTTPRDRAPARREAGRAGLWALAVLLALAGAGGLWWKLHQPSADATAANPAAAGAGGKATGAGAGGGARRFGGGSGAQPVAVRAARLQDIRVMVNAIGSLAASNTAVVHAQVSGVLQSIQFQEGQQVRAGQQLAQIDPRAFAASASQSEGALARDMAQLDNARIDLARYQDLFAKDAGPKQQMDTQQALVHQLEGTVKVDQAALQSAQLQLSYTKVLAPIAGRVGLKQADLGNVVQPGDANGLVSIAQTRPIALVFAIPAAQVPLLQARLAARQALPVQAWDKSGSTQLATGRVSTMDNAIDATTDTIKVKAVFPNTDDALFPNQSVGVRLQLDTLKQVLAVPQAAVLRGTQGFYVYVVEADNTVSTRVLKPGVVDGDWMAVEGALKAGEQVVVDGVDRLRNGAKVEVIVPNARGGAGGKGQGNGKPGADGQAANPKRAASATAEGKAAAPVTSAASSAQPSMGAGAPAASAAADAAGGGDRRAFFQSLSQEERDQLRAMDPDARRAWIDKRRAQAGGGKASAN